jgi:hypothetical protein
MAVRHTYSNSINPATRLVSAITITTITTR